MFCQFLFHVDDLLDLVEEPAIDTICCFGDGAYRDAGHQGILYAEDAVPLWRFDIFEQLFSMHEAFSVIAEADGVILEALAGFLDGFGEASADGHYFSDALHL